MQDAQEWTLGRFKAASLIYSDIFRAAAYYSSRDSQL